MIAQHNPIVQVEDLSMAYDSHPVLLDIDLEIEANTRTAIVGPNGAGKSTLLKGMLGLQPLLTGYVRVMGKPYREVYRDIAYIPQKGNVLWEFPATVFDVALMGRYARLGWLRRPRRRDREKAHDALEQVGMDEFRDRQISELSGGQRQRVFLARALAQDAKLYFMDEPLQGVDMVTEKIIMDLMRRFQDEGKTIIAVHHDLNTVGDYFDHVIMINRRVLAAGPVDTVFTARNIRRTYGLKGGDAHGGGTAR